MKFINLKNSKRTEKNLPEVITSNQQAINKPLKKVKSSFFGIVFKNYRRFKSLSIPMMSLVFLSVLCSISLPLLTQQMSFGISKHLAEISQVPGANPWVDVTGQYWGLEWYVSMWIAIGITFFNMLVMYVTQYLAILLSVKIEVILRQDSLTALAKQDISYYSDKKIGEILTKVISDTQIVGEQASQVPTTILQAILTISGTLGMMFYFEWHLALVVIGVFVILMTILGCSFGFVQGKIKKVREVLTDVNGQVTDRINNIRLIKSNGTEDYETNRFKEVHKDYQKESNKMAGAAALLVTTIFGGIGLLQLGVVASAMLIYQNKPVDGPVFFSTTFASFTLAQGAMIGALFQVVTIALGMAKAGVSATRIEETISAPSLINPHNTTGEIVEGITGNIVFKNVSFAYPEKPTKTILPKFDFTFENGKSYAFVGETGSGKSTISKLLLRYYDPTEGDIFVNENQNLKDVALASYLNHIGYVEQEPSILFGDVFENIRYGNFAASDEEVMLACQKAELHELIMGWPLGYKTILGEHGFMLSGGQKQRLVIARMFLKNPQLLILDEATSALDNIVEKEIQSKLDELMKGRTTITIAHRLSTIKNADQIIVLGANAGGVVQKGSFEELRSIPGHFKNLYEAGLMQ
ncbi:ATP-binding cassette subfamily B protein [Entomoplasma freundtii]|uniref:ABC transporter ATP-binding protein n=1 Tax=Entomoplasma freundtii TaxID=74700 RepID=A0A2K8NRR2_9MOLU|nr:ABC transporter ATP-binding protein [Entomoplasma freundtii]ATZ16535.1 ABC transporter ATP-binding protein [Entomoplasma freundtii]TDY58299.1 ATP-binding cassette subfamily B protein [Entomoplasma freundtii]